MRLFCILSLIGWVVLGFAQVPFDSNLRRYANGNMWEYTLTPLPTGSVGIYRATLKSIAGTPGRFDCELSQKDRSGAWAVFRRHRLTQGGTGNLYAGDVADPAKVLLEGVWTRTTSYHHFPSGMFLNPRVVMRNVGQQQVTAAGRTWNCYVYRQDEANGYLLAWFNTRSGNLIKHEAYLNTSALPFVRVQLNATNVN